MSDRPERAPITGGKVAVIEMLESIQRDNLTPYQHADQAID